MSRRWSRSSRLYSAASLSCALVAGVLLHAYLTRVAAAAGLGGTPVPVVVAAVDIGRGATVHPLDLRVISLPKAFAPPGSFTRVPQASGRIALAGLERGEAVTRSRLARVRAGPVASLTPEGLRASAVPTSLPAGAIAPGDHVDVLATFGSGQPHTETVVSGVEVLLVMGSSSGAGGSLPGSAGMNAGAAGDTSTVTLVLLVSPDQESNLAFAAAFANLAVAIAPAAGDAMPLPGESPSTSPSTTPSYPSNSASNLPSPTTTTPPPTDSFQESPSG